MLAGFASLALVAAACGGSQPHDLAVGAVSNESAANPLAGGATTGDVAASTDPAAAAAGVADSTPGSPAADAGDPAACPPEDHRGVERPQGAGCDIGAYEARVFRPEPLSIGDRDAQRIDLLPNGLGDLVGQVLVGDAVLLLLVLEQDKA